MPLHTPGTAAVLDPSVLLPPMSYCRQQAWSSPVTAPSQTGWGERSACILLQTERGWCGTLTAVGSAGTGMRTSTAAACLSWWSTRMNWSSECGGHLSRLPLPLPAPDPTPSCYPAACRMLTRVRTESGSTRLQRGISVEEEMKVGITTSHKCLHACTLSFCQLPT